MREKIIKDHIKQLTVQVITPKERGTGVLLFYQGKPYILTAYHVIYGKGKKAAEIDGEEIEIRFYNQAQLQISHIKTIGNLILLALNPKELPRFEKVELTHVSYEPHYYIRGFPSGLDKAHNFRAKCNDDALDRDRFKIELIDMVSDTSGEDAISYMQGVSGSGVFFGKNNKLYLVGIVNALANQSGTFNAVECVNLRKLLTQKSLSKKSSFNYLWLGLPLVLGTLVFLWYPKGSESGALAPKTEETTPPKPPISSKRKRAVLHINNNQFRSMIEQSLSKAFILVEDEKKANYIIEATTHLQQHELLVQGVAFVKSDCQLDLKLIKIADRQTLKVNRYDEHVTDAYAERGAMHCFEKLTQQLRPE